MSVRGIQIDARINHQARYKGYFVKSILYPRKKQKAQLEKHRSVAIKASLKEKAIVEEQKSKAEIKMKYYREMYVWEQKNSQVLEKDCVVMEKQQSELESDIFCWQDEFNQQKSKADMAKCKQERCEIKLE